MRKLRPFFLIVDLGFILYWGITAFHVIPARYLYQNYADPLLVAWNWSFFPLDMAVAATGLASVRQWRKNDSRWEKLALLSLALTSASGLQAVAFWAWRREFDPAWWVPNLFLMVYPWFFIPGLVKGSQGRESGPDGKSAQ